jgi:hypothetical protein
MAFRSLLRDFDGAETIKEWDVSFTPGQVIELRGVFDDDSDAGAALVVILRPHKDKGAYYASFVEAVSGEWGWHLFDRTDATKVTLIKLIKVWGDTKVKVNKGEEIEWITAWRVLSEREEDVALDEVPWLQHQGKAKKSIDFIRGWMVSDKAPDKATIPRD